MILFRNIYIIIAIYNIIDINWGKSLSIVRRRMINLASGIQGSERRPTSLLSSEVIIINY